MAEPDGPGLAAFRRVFGDAFADHIKAIRDRNSINSVQRERAERQRVIDAEREREKPHEETRRPKEQEENWWDK